MNPVTLLFAIAGITATIALCIILAVVPASAKKTSASNTSQQSLSLQK